MPFFRDIWKPEFFAPKELNGKVYSIPFYWGSPVLAWNTEAVSGNLNSWSVLVDPKYKGKTATLDQGLEMYALCSLMAGKDINSLSEDQLKETGNIAVDVIKNQKSFWSTGDDIKQWLSTGEVQVAYCWDGIARALVKEGLPIRYSYPKEGVRTWIDGPGIITGAPHPNAAATFINYSCGEKIAGVEMATRFLYAPTNSAALSALDDSIKQILQVRELSEFLERGSFKLQKIKDNDFIQIGKWWSDIRSRAF